MEFKIKRKDFLDGLMITQGVVEKKNTMPVLANVLIETTGSGINISATDLEVAMMTSVSASVIKQGRITVLARSLQDIVKESAHEDIHLSVLENDKIELKSGSARFKIAGLNANEFPTFPKVEEKAVEIPCDLFLGMIEKTAFSMANDETRYNLNGVLFQKSGEDHLKMVSTDGHRLSLSEKRVSIGGLGNVNVIIPKKGVGELKRMVSKEGSFELSVGTKGLLAKKGNEALYIRFLDGTFPEYEAIIPKDNSLFATVLRTSLIGALRRVSLLSNERSKGVIFAFSPGHLEVSTTNPDLGEAREEFDIDYKGKKLNIGFNARYFLDVLDILKDESIIIALKSETNACMVKSEMDAGYTYVIMPMRI